MLSAAPTIINDNIANNADNLFWRERARLQSELPCTAGAGEKVSVRVHFLRHFPLLVTDWLITDLWMGAECGCDAY